jgi:hypothetical protein
MSIMLFLFAAVLALVLINVPIAVSLGIVAIVAMLATHGLETWRWSSTTAPPTSRCSPFRCSSWPARS